MKFLEFDIIDHTDNSGYSVVPHGEISKPGVNVIHVIEIAAVEDIKNKAVSLVTKKIEKIKQLERIITTLKVSPGTINEELQKAFDKEQSKNESLRQKLENAKAGKL